MALQRVVALGLEQRREGGTRLRLCLVVDQDVCCLRMWGRVRAFWEMIMHAMSVATAIDAAHPRPCTAVLHVHQCWAPS